MRDSSRSHLNLFNNFWLKSVLFGTLALSLVTGLFLPNYLLIKKISIFPTQSKIIGIEELKGKNLFFLDLEQTTQELLNNNPKLETINLFKKYPNQLEIQIIKSKSVAQIKTDGHYLIISNKAKIVEKIREANPKLLIVQYYQKIRDFEAKIGQTLINQDLRASIALIQEGQKQNFRLKTVKIPKPGQIQVQLSNPETIIAFSSKKNIAKNWRIVHNIIRSLKIKGQSPKEINLLFEKPFFVL